MMKYLRRTRAIAHKELLHMARDIRVVYMALGLPVVMLVLFGFGVSMDIDHLPIAVLDQDNTPASRRLVESLVAGGAFSRKVDIHSPGEAETLLRKGTVRAAIVVPRGFARDRARGMPTSAQLLIDGSDTSVASIAMGNAIRIVQSMPPDNRVNLGPALSAGPSIKTRFNPAMLSAYNIVPGVIVMILGMVSTMLTALTVAGEWERGNMEQLFATPVRRSQIILGKLIPYAALGFVQTLLVLTLGTYMFGVPIVGSLALLFGASLLFLLCTLGLGLLLSVATKSQALSIQLSVILGMLPVLLLSGFMFPIANMPKVLQGISMAFPGRYFLSVLRGILLKGNGADVLAWDLLALGVFALLVVSLAVVKFRRRLD
jgi:ABC-2 type transport system permease protein